MRSNRFSGVFSLLLTPFESDGTIDWNAYERYVEWQLAWKPDGLFAVCGTSEMKWLTTAERLDLARRAVALAGGTPVVATANLDPEPARHPEELRRMAQTGVAGVVLVPPSGLGENQQRLGEYFARVIDASPCSVLIYEWPMTSPHLVDASVYGELVRSHGLAGIKDTTCTMEGIEAKIEQGGGATVFQANAPFMLDSIRRGAGGIMAIVSAAAADYVLRFWRAAAGGAEEATPLHEQLVLLDCALGRGGAYPATAKHLAALRGAPMGLTCRAPAEPAPEVLKAIEVWLACAERSEAQ